jgi:hypothetical protein
VPKPTLCAGPATGQRSSERTNSRNGYRYRQFRHPRRQLRFGNPEAGYGSYFPAWLLERRKRAEPALTTVVATCYLLGVSTRRMDKLVETLGITSLSKSQVSVMADTSLPAEGTRVARCLGVVATVPPPRSEGSGEFLIGAPGYPHCPLAVRGRYIGLVTATRGLHLLRSIQPGWTAKPPE